MSQNKEYFALAKDWQYDRVEAAKLNANRWFTAFMGASIIIILMTIAIIVMLPLKTLIPVVIHQSTKTGEVWVDRPTTNYVPDTQAETEADIVRYITTRESYSASDINQRFHLVMILSNKDVAQSYAAAQANSNKDAPVNMLGTTGSKTINIEDIVFIDKENTQEVRHFREPSSNLAKVDFTTSTINPDGSTKTEYWVATIGWVYKGLPQDEKDAWDNWNGFTVTTYRVDQRILST